VRAEVQGVFEHEGAAAVKYHHDHIEDAHTSRERLLVYVHARNSLVCLSWPDYEDQKFHDHSDGVSLAPTLPPRDYRLSERQGIASCHSRGHV
jgi:hypothetical protein